MNETFYGFIKLSDFETQRKQIKNSANKTNDDILFFTLARSPLLSEEIKKIVAIFNLENVSVSQYAGNAFERASPKSDFKETKIEIGLLSLLLLFHSNFVSRSDPFFFFGVTLDFSFCSKKLTFQMHKWTHSSDVNGRAENRMVKNGERRARKNRENDAQWKSLQ